MTTNLPARADGTHLTLAGEHARAREQGRTRGNELGR